MNPKREFDHIRAASIREWRNWRKLRKDVLKYYKTCQMCGDTKKLEGHHIFPRHLFPEYALTWLNIFILCDSCHFRFGHYRNYKRYNPGIKEMTAMVRNLRLYHFKELGYT